jgi:hypothetical protein
MLDRCDLGDAIVLGDSRAAAGIIPARLPLRATNFAIGGGEAIEAWSVLERALACPSPPKLVIISIDPGHFGHPDMFWERSVRFGFMTDPDISELREASRRADDFSVYDSQHIDQLPLTVRDWFYRVGFPPLYFANLARGGLFFHWARNRRIFAATQAPARSAPTLTWRRSVPYRFWTITSTGCWRSWTAVGSWLASSPCR